jgi:hypothetical protein
MPPVDDDEQCKRGQAEQRAGGRLCPKLSRTEFDGDRNLPPKNGVGKKKSLNFKVALAPPDPESSVGTGAHRDRPDN